MFSIFKKIFGRTGAILVEVSLVLCLLIVLVGGVLVWRLTTDPIDLEFAKTSIEEALHDEVRGLRLVSSRIVLYWPDLKGPLLLGLEDARVIDEQERAVISVEEVALGLNKGRLLIGQVAPEALVLKRPNLQVTRLKDGTFDVGVEGFGVSDAEQGPGEDEEIIQQILDFLDESDDNQDAPLAKLKRFEIDEARLVVEDQMLGFVWEAITASASVSPIEGALKAVLSFDVPQEQVANALPLRVEGQAVLNRDTHRTAVDLRVENLAPAMLAHKIPDLSTLKTYNGLFSAQMSGVLDAQLMPVTMDAQVISAKGEMAIEGVYNRPRPYEDFLVSVSYDADEGAFKIPQARLTLIDVTMRANASFSTSENNVNGSYRIELDDLNHEQIDPLWPKDFKDDNAYEWVVEKLSNGRFSNVYAQGELNVDKGEEGWSFDPDLHLKNVRAGWDFVTLDANYRAPLAPVTGASGRGEFILDEEKLTIEIDEAMMSGLAISKADLEFVNIIQAGKGQADINVQASGTLLSVLKYIAAEPLAVKPDFDTVNAKGAVELSVNLGFPTTDGIKLSDFDVDIKGRLKDAVVPRVLKDMTLSGGPFALDINSERLKISGAGKLEGRPVQVSYEEFLESQGKAYSSRVTASGVVDPGLREKFGMDLSSFLDGSAAVNVVYTSFGGGRSEANVSADLTQARLYVEPFDYEKPVGVVGSTSLKAILKNGVLSEIEGLSGTAPGLKLETSRLMFRERAGETELASGKISRFSLGETVAGLEFEVEPSGKVKLSMNGPFLDLRPFLNSEEEDPNAPYDAPPLQLYVAVNGMRTADDQVMRNGKIFADIDALGKFNQLEMDGVAGQGDIYLRYKPDGSGKRVFRFEADDAGAALAAFDLYDNIRGGKMVIYGEPINGVFDRNLLGRAELTNFRVVDAPSLAKLLGAMSLPGLDQTLRGEGLVFTKLEANFDWRYRQEGSLLVLKDGRTSGNSLGLTFDGTFDNARSYVDVEGTIIPLSGVNAAIGNIPLLGDILTGGTGALIAATYTMKGEGKDPQVSVNPLSALTPGILRRILFEN